MTLAVRHLPSIERDEFAKQVNAAMDRPGVPRATRQ